jgi:TonB family protein
MARQGCLLLLLVSSLIAQAQTPIQATQSSEPLRCELQRDNADTLSTKPWSHLHFILSSARDGLRIYADWNSWGKFARSFTLTDTRSNKYQVTARHPSFWDKNFPGSVKIDHGEVLVTDVYLCDGTWQVSPKLPLEEIYWTVTGHYTLQQETAALYVREFQTDEVWHGTIDSAPLELVLTKDCVLVLNSGKKQEETKKINISAGVAGGVTARTQPVYPPIAKAARVSGTVVLEATISKTGIVSELRVVSGPFLLQQASLDAVRVWRYRPFMVKGLPTEAKTIVNVVFTLAEDGTATAKATGGDLKPVEPDPYADDSKQPESK